MKLSIRKVLPFAALGAALCAVCGARADTTTTLDGARFLGVPYSSSGLGHPQTLWNAFDLFPSTYYDNSGAFFDAGTPRTVTGAEIVIRNDATGVSRTKNFKIYGSNDPDVFEDVIIENVNTELETGLAVNVFPCVGGAKGPYRYFKLTGSSNLDYSPTFFSTDLHLTQDRPHTWETNDLGQEDPADGVLFRGRMDYVPSGTADVHVFVGETDHGDDYAAWEADSRKFTATGFATGESWTLRATGLAAGRHVSRAFAVQGATKTASQRTWPLITGTSPYYPVCCVPDSLTTVANCMSGKRFYDGVTTLNPDCYLTTMTAIFELDDPDVEVVAARLWPVSAGGTGADRSYAGQWSVSASAIDSTKFVQRGVVNGSRTLDTFDTTDPIADWTPIGDGAEYVDIETSVPYVTETFLDEGAVKYPKSLKLGNVSRWAVYEVELRTLPRPAEPDVADFSCDEVGGIFAKFSGHVTYRGNAQSDCTVLISCVPSGEDPVYVPYAEGLASGADFAATVQGLAGETEYDWSILVSNALAGVEAASGTFTTMQSGGLPTAEVVSVETNEDGTVTVDFDVTSAGGTAVADVYAVYGTSPGALDAEILLAEDQLGQGSAVLSGLLPGQLYYIAVRAKNAAGEEGEISSAVECTTVGPCGLADVVFAADGFVVRATGTLVPRGLGDADIYFESGTESGVYTQSTKVGTVVAGAAADFDVTGRVAHAERAFVRLRAVNAIGDSAWTNVSSEVELAPGVMLPALSTHAGLQAAIYSSSGRYAGGSDCAQVDYDLGSLKTITGVSFMLSTHPSAITRMKNFKILASADGKTYETVFTNADRELVQGGVYISHPVDADHHGPYRYYRAYDPNYVCLNDLRLLSAELAVEGNRPETWADRAQLLAEEDDSVVFSGKLLSAPAGTAHVYAVLAARDFGTDFAAWQAGGTVVDLGVVEDGAAFSHREDDVRPGNYLCRYFAVSGADVYANPRVFTVAAATKPFVPSCIYLLSAGLSGTYPLSKVFDGDVARNNFCEKSGEQYFVFPLAGIPDGQVLSAVRIWARQDSPSRIIGAPVEFSFDDVDLDAISSEYTTVGVRTVRQLDAFPEMTWVAAGALTNRADLVDYWGGFRTSTELALDLPAAKRLPTFVRIRKGTFENTCNFSEFELRLMELPPEPEGTAQVDEVGSSYVKLSGHLLNRGNASSDCTVRFVARPAVGEPTVATVAEGVTTGDDFAATVKKLKPETAYDWQIVVSNALAGAVFGSGSFTTQAGAGDDPAITFVDAVTNADGSVSVSYNVTSAGGDCDKADVYLLYGTSPDDLSDETRIAADVLGAGTVKVTGLPLGTRLYLALVAKNAEEGESEPTEQKTCDTAGPCGLEKIVMVADGWKVHVTGTLAPRGVGDAVLSIEYGAASGAYTGSVALGTVPAGAAADFSFDAQMPRIAAAYCRVKAVNAQSGQEWTTTSEEVARGFGGDIPDLWTAQNAPVGCKWLAGYYGGGSDTSTFDFDNGRLMNVTGVRFMLSSHGRALDRMTGFTVQGSVDGKTFTPIFHNAGRPLYQGAGLWMSLPLDEGGAGEYRYFRVSTKNGRGNNDYVTVVLVRMLTQDLVVDGERPRFWTDESLGGTDVVPGVTFKGRLSSAPTGSADVYVAYAKRDLGDTFAAWRARGHVVRVGTVAEGESFSLAKDDIRPGDWVCRYFAVSGASEFTPLYAFGFSVGTRAFFPSKAYILNSAYGSGNSTLMKAYDGSATTRPDLSNGEKDFVFPLDEIPEGWRLASVRIWGAGVRDRMIGTPVSVSFDAVDLETDSVVLATANNRTVKGVTAFPDGQTWTQAGVFSDYAAVLDYWRSGEQLTEITLSEKLCRRRPKFLKVNKGSVYTGFCTAEIELRLVREPALAIIVR